MVRLEKHENKFDIISRVHECFEITLSLMYSRSHLLALVVHRPCLGSDASPHFARKKNALKTVRSRIFPTLRCESLYHPSIYPPTIIQQSFKTPSRKNTTQNETRPKPPTRPLELWQFAHAKTPSTPLRGGHLNQRYYIYPNSAKPGTLGT
jgi:hypothetical protein